MSALRLLVLVGALLLFGLEPAVGKLVLPTYGGGVHVWATCLTVFQGLLFLGYLYAHYAAPRLGGWHLLVLCSALWFLPISVPTTPDPQAPVWSLIADLLPAIGVPFLFLSTTSVIAQDWLARSRLPQRSDPYQLYGLSNAGSLLALLGYPFVVEPLLGLGAQRTVWSVAFVGYVALTAVAFAVVRPRPTDPAAPATDDPAPLPVTGRDVAYWLALSAAPSALLLAVTNVIATDLGSMPLIWVLPLIVYLSSFILLFGPQPRHPTLVRKYWFHVALLGLLVFTGTFYRITWLAMGVHLATLFAICMAAHGELHRVRPHPRHLTTFYLVISLGGWIGGSFVSLVAPVLFDHIHEYPIAIAVVVGTLWAGRRAALAQWLRSEDRLIVAGTGLMAVVVAAVFGRSALANRDGLVDVHRNFYGVYSVRDVAAEAGQAPYVRRLSHGTTDHGLQLLDPTARDTPLLYYHRRGPLGDLLPPIRGGRRVGAVGLGVGAMAAYFTDRDELVFYEIDPDCEVLARRHFHFLEACPAQLRVVHGDARLMLGADPLAEPGGFDLLVIDAFSSDAIPTHLLTREALALYLDKLAPDGMLAFHISNRYYDLRRVLRSTGDQWGLHGAYRLDPGTDDELGRQEHAPSHWYAMHRRPDGLSALVERGWQPADGLDPIAPWTDDHSNLLSVARLPDWMGFAR